MVTGRGEPLDTRTPDEIAGNRATGKIAGGKIAAQVATAGPADEAIDLLLDELKLEIAGKLTAEQKARFVAGAIDIMVTIRMTQGGRIPSAQSAVWGQPREGGG